MLHLQNTLTGNKEQFIPITPNKVGIYVCGVTLYDHIHIGHLKSILTFEILRNYFLYQGFETTLVRNITDIDDKIIQKAIAEGSEPLDLVNKYIGQYHVLLEELEMSPPDHEPRVTQYLPQIEKYINDLQEKGFAYRTADGIYFDTTKIGLEKYPLSKKVIADLQEGNGGHDKNHPSDFALWKNDSTYGYGSSIFPSSGRPGWHIECSVMHHHTLGEHFDIHGGGRDLIFPHHENEITQSIAHNGINPANYWIHNGMMTREGKKLSKSVGNSIYVHELLQQYSVEGLKLFLLKGQYHQSQEYSEVELIEAHTRIGQFMAVLNQLTDAPFKSVWDEFMAALEDNLNTPKIVVLIYQGIRELIQTRSKGLASEILAMLQLLSVIGKNHSLESLYLKWQKIPDVSIVELSEKRAYLKSIQDWQGADAIRQKLKESGWEISDKKDGTYQLNKI